MAKQTDMVDKVMAVAGGLVVKYKIVIILTTFWYGEGNYKCHSVGTWVSSHNHFQTLSEN